MKDDIKTIQQVKKLKMVRATQEWSDTLRVRVMNETVNKPFSHEKNAPENFSWLSFFGSPIRVALSGTFIVLIISSLFMHKQIIVGSNFLVALWDSHNGSNAYEKSLPLLAYADAQTDRFKNTSNTTIETAYLKKAVISSQQELRTLSLMGEEGKYTQEQCLFLYSRYDTKLDNIQEIIAKKLEFEQDPVIRRQLEDLSTTVNNALTETKSRINLYPKQ